MTLRERLPPGKYRLTVDDFARLDRADVFGTDRTELIDGDIIVMNGEYRPHGWVRDELFYRLRQSLERMGSSFTATGGSVRLSDHDMPLPDIVLTDQPRGEGPIPLSSVALVIEVSSTTLQRDMGSKAASYARAGIPEYWVVDLEGGTLHQFWSPQQDGFADRKLARLGDAITAATLSGLSVVLPTPFAG